LKGVPECDLIDRIVHMIAAPLTFHETHALEHPEVLGNCWLTHTQQCGQGIHAESVRVSLATQELQ
jgi:hypothetical protein